MTLFTYQGQAIWLISGWTNLGLAYSVTNDPACLKLGLGCLIAVAGMCLCISIYRLVEK